MKKKQRRKKKSEESSSEEESSDEESSEDEEEETIEERRKRKQKEYLHAFSKKNGPKNPPTAYVLYMAHIRPVVAAKHPTVKTQDVLKLIGPMWKALSKEEKEPFQVLAQEKKAAQNLRKRALSIVITIQFH